MKSKKLFYFFIVLLFTNTLPSQNLDEFAWVNNKDIKYEFVRTSLKLISLDTVVPSKVLVQVNIKDSSFLPIDSLDKQMLLNNLINENRDWATNLLLYSIYEKDAYLLKDIDRSEWTLYGKKEDLKYWIKFLSM